MVSVPSQPTLSRITLKVKAEVCHTLKTQIMADARVDQYLDQVDEGVRQREKVLGLHSFHSALAHLLKENDTNSGYGFSAKYKSIVGTSMVTQSLAIVAIIFSIIDTIMDWTTIVLYASPDTVVAMWMFVSVLLAGYVGNLFYLFQIRRVLRYLLHHTFLLNPRAEESPTEVEQIPPIYHKCACWFAKKYAKLTGYYTRPPGLPEVQMNPMNEDPSEPVLLPLKPEEIETIRSAFLNSFQESQRTLAYGVLSAFSASSIILNHYCFTYMREINRMLKIDEKTSRTFNFRIKLHCMAVLLFVFNFSTKVASKLELYTESMPQIILQVYMVLYEPFHSKSFWDNVDIPVWRLVGFVISFISLGNSSRSILVGRWEYLYYENTPEMEQRNLKKSFHYPAPCQLLKLLSNSCILGSLGVNLGLIFLANLYWGFATLIFASVFPTLSQVFFPLARLRSSRRQWTFIGGQTGYDPAKELDLRGTIFIQTFNILIRLPILSVLFVVTTRMDLTEVRFIILGFYALGGVLEVIEKILFQWLEKRSI